MQTCPNVNVISTITAPAAAGAYEALKAVGKDDGSVLIVAVDGGCPGVANVKSGVIGAWPTVPRMPSVPKYFRVKNPSLKMLRERL